ncbi:MAG: adenine deaminase [Candidatus Omnitrophota bacterium]
MKKRMVLGIVAVVCVAFPLAWAADPALKISGNIVDVVTAEIYPGTLIIKDGKIQEVVRDDKIYVNYIIPGLVDAHVHIESSLLPPSEFARLAVVHGTVATVSDPHEIANVLGIPGIDYMIEDAKKGPFKFNFGASSCVPATAFETAGAKIDAEAVGQLLQRSEIKYLSEMMNYPGVLQDDPEVMAKLKAARDHKEPVDGHAPGLMGEDLKKYAGAGISTDHETLSFNEGAEKVALGMKVIIREGSAAQNFNVLHKLIGKYPAFCMFGSDDKHSDDLVKGHINDLVKRAFALGYDKMAVLRCASYNPVKHYGLDVGLLQKGDPADLVVVDDLERFNIMKVYINGRLVAQNGKSLLARQPADSKNQFLAHEKKPEDFRVKAKPGVLNVIGAIEGQLVTQMLKVTPKVVGGYAVSDPDRDLLKITVVNRYQDVPPAVAFVKRFGLKKGAMASSFAHDSHNVIAVGVSDEDIARAVNLVVRHRGGLALVHDQQEHILSLPIAGLMSTEDGYQVAEQYSKINATVKELGSHLKAPYMTLSFMALLVIPDLKLSDKGLFDGRNFRFIDLFDSPKEDPRVKKR